jgi:GNAT superfamily N-acetyltransferase
MAEGIATFIPNAHVKPHDLTDLREVVGWERHDEDYPAALKGYWATMSGFDTSGALIAWCAILSDGVRHAVLIDVIVHPHWQRQGIGQALVAAAVSHIRERGISIVHVDFEPEHTTFYERCGFRTGLGGIYEGRLA